MGVGKGGAWEKIGNEVADHVWRACGVLTTWEDTRVGKSWSQCVYYVREMELGTLITYVRGMTSR